jgi:two-component system chemotaxis sensor kinase CheA
MTIQDDETLQMYLEESREHLDSIENDFLAIEAGGADIDDELVNKVYRAAHSIKGGAGFMGLVTIKDLTHEMENILGKIRGREMVPTSEVINILLDASDCLKELIGDVLNSNDKDISQHVQAMQAILDKPQSKASPAATPPDEKTPEAGAVQEVVDGGRGDSSGAIEYPGSGSPFNASWEEIETLLKDGKCIYAVKLLCQEDILQSGRSPYEIIQEMTQTGTILSAIPALPALDELDDTWRPEQNELYYLFATILKPGDINVLFNIDKAAILEVTHDMTLKPLEERSAESYEPSAQVDNDTQESSPEAPAIMEQTETDLPDMADAPESAGEAEYTQNSSEEKIAKPRSFSKKEQETSLRVHVSLLDQLMTLAGELVLSRNQLLQSMSNDDQRASEIAGQRIDLITSELQEAIMLTRMQSIGNVFNKFPRVVRDLARTLGKKVELTLEGKEVELDKTIIEAIGDPLTHLVRNAVDHGIELPDIRRRARKSPVGRIYLKAYHEAGQVNIEIADDGKGLEGKLLARKAVERGLISEDQATMISDKEKINLIFLPGFSTAEKVTDVSGRGVGMDVVKTNLDKLGGLIDIDSEPGKGSTIRIKLPLTLAIIPSQVVRAGAERYAIPQVNLEELLRIPADQVKRRIERVGDAEVVRLRGNLLPLVKLTDIIGIESTYVDEESGERKIDRRKSISDQRVKGTSLFRAPKTEEQERSSETNQERREHPERRYHAASALNIVVVSTGAMKYGLVVDELNDSEEIVVKPLGRDLKQCKGYAGATIMGDGRVALILDVGNLAQMAGLTSVDGSTRAADLAKETQDAVRAMLDRQSLLVFRSAEDEQFAAPLNLVERIEKIKASDIEQVGAKRVVKYRGGTLPLFSIDEVAAVKPLADSENLLVIVFVVANREIGLLAIGPVDAIETVLDVDPRTLKQTGIMGSAIINEHTTQLVDIYEIVQTLNPDWLTPQEVVCNEEGDAPTILFAEDSNFFRSQVKSYMEEEGYKVIEAEDGAIAWDLLQQHADQISIVVTDIEMPNMNGFELTSKIKGNPAFAQLPVVALTTLAGEGDIAQGKKVGIDDYQIKLDREKLVKSIYRHLKAL